MVFFRVLSRLPFGVLYVLADVIFVLTYYIVGYRRKVVFDNLRKAFPEKSETEIRHIAKGFYHNLTDVMVETLKGLTISADEVRQRIKITNSEVITKWLVHEKKVVLLTAGHLCNWEWVLFLPALSPHFALDGVFKPLSNAFFGQFLNRVRTRFGARMIPMSQSLRELMKDKTPRIFGLGSDQNPDNPTNAYWTTFFGQDTPFMNGNEKLAQRFGYPLIYLEILRLKQGYYEFIFSELAVPPYETIVPNQLTQTYVNTLENTIRKQPQNWLWSHRRWKHKREV